MRTLINILRTCCVFFVSMLGCGSDEGEAAGTAGAGGLGGTSGQGGTAGSGGVSGASGASGGAGSTGGTAVGGSAGTGTGGSAGCAHGIEVDSDALRTESVAQLRAFFGQSEGLDQGRLYYRDGVTSIGSCPIYDQSAIVYSTPIDPVLVPQEILAEPAWSGKTPHVAYTWGLNGLRYVFFSNEDHAKPGMTWALDRYPVSACASLDGSVTPARAAEIETELVAVAGDVPVENILDVVMCWGPRVDDENARDLDGSDHAYYQQVLTVAEAARAIPEVVAIEWSPVSYGSDWELEDPIPVQDGVIHPACLRSKSAQWRARPGEHFASLDSFPPPFGPGWQDNPATVDCR